MMMNQGMHMGMNQGTNMGMMPQGNMTNMASMPGMMPGSGLEGFLGSILSTGITLLLLAVLVAGTVFLARALWETFKAKQNTTQSPQTVVLAKQVEVLDN
ncbi:hypothetical protein [Sporomusa acidovorans]|uniref:hypothetical protein n=1 Tax=Sporomusa acidovorans TaxID=112900 RepID=UPI00088937E9|nr:hypothetical protein [Sporomusa acidovorans]OZC18989.1 hypothetical protein SPACI_30750 [Sporomusa acidovorans DSM 3132]SDD72253.1 hypothetical protein SAMN04488499_1003163 [Sporomusa acidovorans]